MNHKGVERVRSVMKNRDMDAFIMKGTENIYYLSGFRGSEATLVVTPGEVVLLTDFRYITHAREVAGEVRIAEIRDRKRDFASLKGLAGAKRAGFDSFHMLFNEYETWRSSLEGTELVPLGSEIEEIRKCKEEWELEKIQKAIDIATEAFVQVLGKLEAGLTEKHVADELDYAMKRLGAERPAFDTIVASGPRAALPHAQPTLRPIGEGETIVLDFGAQVDGYCSDETCTISIGGISGEMAKVFALVSDARKLGIERVKPGLPIRELDVVVRDHIAAAGYGEYFRHATGHGVGLAVHESPAINSLAQGVLEENMVLTIEPGVYIPDLGGVRLEDMVVVTGDGARVLTKIEKESIRIER